MYCLSVQYPMPDNPDQFREYYLNRHIPLAETLPGLRAYEVAWPKALGDDADVPFCIFRGYFENAQAMQKALMSEEGSEVAADVPAYSPKGATMCHFPVETKELSPA